MYREYGQWDGGVLGRDLIQHRNDGLEIVSISGGSMEWAVEGVAESVTPGSLFFTLPWQLHGSASPVPVGARLAWLVIPLQGSEDQWDFAEQLGLHFSAERWTGCGLAFGGDRHCHQAPSGFHALLGQAIQSIEEDDALRTRCLVQLLLSEALRSIEAGVDEVEDTSDSLLRVRRWIEQVRQDPCGGTGDLEWEAAGCGLARTRFADLVERETGDTPMRYRTRQRVLLAAEWLRSTSRSVTDIALRRWLHLVTTFCASF